MDRRFLSDQDVVAKSRDFVCVRLATYESAAEAEFLKSVFIGRSGQLENTVFAILAPDGRTPLVRAGRSPDHSFRGDDAPRAMAAAMEKFAAQYPAKNTDVRPLPYLADLRRAINVAACDIQALAIVSASTQAAREKIEATLAPMAWSKEFVGRLAYVSLAKGDDIAVVEDGGAKDGVLIVQPDTYGLKAKVLARDAGTDPESLARAMRGGLEKFVAETKDSQKHIQEGRRRGVYWKTEIPVTDPGPRRSP